ncbi:MAG: LamG domain-containing protein [Bacteroidetes bacterium]|nr:LamG domain-containing protein [Bacteroidota bacterium]
MKKFLSILLLIFYYSGTYYIHAQDLYSAKLTSAGSQRLKVADNASLSYTGNNTLEFWFKINTQPGSPITVMGKTAGNGGGGWLLYYGVDWVYSGCQFGIYNFSYTENVFTSAFIVQTITTNTWYHIAIVETVANPAATRWEFFFNGTSVGNGLGGNQGGGCTLIDNSTNLYINGVQSYGDFQIDDVRLWNVARSGGQINDNKCVEINSASNLQASWHLNNSLVDGSGNGNTLTNENSATFVSDMASCLASAPSVTSPTSASITSTGATLGANVTSDGGATITARGTCWGTSANPTTNCLAEGSTTSGVFTHARTGMPAGTLIYYRGYATNGAGTGYSSDDTFTTLNIPTITTPTATYITSNSATMGANITSNGGATITSRGTCWGTSANPTTNCVAEGGTATGIFTQARTGLSSSPVIYYRGYATNSVGTAYSSDGTFTTLFTPATINWNNSNVQEITLTTSRSFIFTNGKSGGIYNLMINQNATGGWAISWPSDVKWAGGIVPTFTATPNATDLVKFIYNGTYYLGNGITLDIK